MNRPNRLFPSIPAGLPEAVLHRFRELLGMGPTPQPVKVERIRHAIGSDMYDNDKKLSIALDRMIDRMERDGDRE